MAPALYHDAAPICAAGCGPSLSKRDAVNLDRTDDKRAIDALTATFFDAFTNDRGAAARIDGIYDVFIPRAIIIKNTGSAPEIYDLVNFVEPRRALLAGGSLRNFAERELSERTEIVGNIAQRWSTYGKSGWLDGEAFEARGVKTIQFVKTAGVWRMSALAWDDEPFR